MVGELMENLGNGMVLNVVVESESWWIDEEVGLNRAWT